MSRRVGLFPRRKYLPTRKQLLEPSERFHVHFLHSPDNLVKDLHRLKGCITGLQLDRAIGNSDATCIADDSKTGTGFFWRIANT